ncbi:MAG TPA: glycosyltransferase [Thermomicrobiales bacterium]
MAVATIVLLLMMAYCYLLAGMALLRSPDPPAGPAVRLFYVLIIPALNEEAVIGRTLASLLAMDGDFLILVVDDGSDDATAAVVERFRGDGRVRLLVQPEEHARRGKGAALNAAYAEIWRLGLAKRYGADNVVVAVFDSDAQVAPDFLEKLSSSLADPTVAGVQSAVRMYNGRQNLLTRWQDFEFAVWGAIFCRAKNLLGTATLGGNGQCARLSALASLGRNPWNPSSLTEDLDLSLRLLLNGWKMRFCPSTAVWQEAVPTFRRLVRQRSRWMQGHFVCWQYLPALLRSPLPAGARADLGVYLLLPSVFLPIGLACVATWARFSLNFGDWTWTGLVAWYFLGFGLAPVTAVALRRTEREPWRACIVHAHLFVFYSFVWFVAAASAFGNVMLGRRAWAKTSRSMAGVAPSVEASRSTSGG